MTNTSKGLQQQWVIVADGRVQDQVTQNKDKGPLVDEDPVHLGTVQQSSVKAHLEQGGSIYFDRAQLPYSDFSSYSAGNSSFANK